MGRKLNQPECVEIMAARLQKLKTNTKELAKYLGCSTSAVNQFCAGTSRPSIESLVKIARFYGVSTDYILGLTDDKPPYLTAEERTGFSSDFLDKMREMGPERLSAILVLLKGK